MKIRCNYCGAFMEATDKVCANCAGSNDDKVSVGGNKVNTLEGLKAYCTRRKVPLKGMHIHLDEDYREPKAYGIYKDGDNFIVYKNKSDGTRSIRYEGKDEAYAVNEIYLKIRDLMVEGGL